MTNEEMQNKMQFIIEQQAQFAVNIQRLEEAQIRTEGAIVAIVNIVGKLTEAQERTEIKLAELAEAQKLTDARLSETNEALVETNERLNTFINVVERFISEGRNGKSQG